jgi:hypothetical protein
MFKLTDLYWLGALVAGALVAAEFVSLPAAPAVGSPPPAPSVPPLQPVSASKGSVSAKHNRTCHFVPGFSVRFIQVLLSVSVELLLLKRFFFRLDAEHAWCQS